MSTPDGVLVVDKAAGPTSHDVVATIRRRLRVTRVGHLGTLDPMASGVLPLVLGRATRLSPYFPATGKVYEAAITFGRATDTYDAQGAVTRDSGRVPDRAALEAALAAFRGTFLQTPPVYSAKKIGGVSAHRLARRDAEVTLEPVAVTLDRLDLLAYDAGVAQLRLDVRSGFYVRSLAHDLGEALGTGAHLSGLRRLEAAGFTVDGSVPWELVVTADPSVLSAHVQPLDRLLPTLPAVAVSDAEADRLRHGQDLRVPPGAVATGPDGRADVIRLVGTAGTLVALARSTGPGLLHPVVVVG